MRNRGNEWAHKKRIELIEQFGGKCQKCGSTENLEFAHKESTELDGSGRGMRRRVYDVIKHPEKYWLACPECHDEYDAEHGGKGSRRTQKRAIARSKGDLRVSSTQG